MVVSTPEKICFKGPKENKIATKNKVRSHFKYWAELVVDAFNAHALLKCTEKEKAIGSPLVKTQNY